VVFVKNFFRTIANIDLNLNVEDKDKSASRTKLKQLASAPLKHNEKLKKASIGFPDENSS
jgi:hypothetical protein